jgi:hypothetical protein
MAPDDIESGDNLGDRILVSLRASRNVPSVVLVRCARIALLRRQSLPVNDRWQEPAVTDIDGQLVIMVLRVHVEAKGRRALIVETARYKPKGRR